VRAVRDTPVADYSARRVNTTRCVVYRPPITVSLYLCVLSVSYVKRSLSRCGQLWQYVGMGSLGRRLHRDCNAMGDAVNISPRVPSTCAQNAILSVLIIHIIPSRQIYLAIDNPSLVPSVCCLTTSSYLWNYMCAADNISHAENLQSNGCRCFSHWTNFETGSKLHEFSGIVVGARADQYSTKAPSSFWRLILNSDCSCHGSRPFSAP